MGKAFIIGSAFSRTRENWRDRPSKKPTFNFLDRLKSSRSKASFGNIETRHGRRKIRTVNRQRNRIFPSAQVKKPNRSKTTRRIESLALVILRQARFIMMKTTTNFVTAMFELIETDP
jgi:hypothetical protein